MSNVITRSLNVATKEIFNMIPEEDLTLASSREPAEAIRAIN